MNDQTLISTSQTQGVKNNTEHCFLDIWQKILGLEKGSYGIDDNFIKLGGDSILATILCGKVRDELGIEIGVQELIQFGNTREIIEFINKSNSVHTTSSNSLNSLNTTDKFQEILPANNLQQVYINHFLKRKPEDDTYMVQVIWTYETDICFPGLIQAWKKTIQKYPSLRLSFHWESGKLLQIFSTESQLNFFSHENENLSDPEIESFIKQDRLNYFELSECPLFRVNLIKTKSGWTCIFTAHQSILDKWSIKMVIESVHKFYSDLTLPIDEDTAFIRAQQLILQNRAVSIKYWEDYLSDFEDISETQDLMTERRQVTPVCCIANPICLKVHIDRSEFKLFRKTCESHGVTICSALQWLWHEVLYLFGRFSSETMVGVIFSGRDLPIHKINSSVGLYNNVLPIGLNHDKFQTVLEEIHEIQETAFEHSSRAYGLPPNKQSAFNILLIYESKNESSILDMEFRERINYPIVIYCIQKPEGLEIELTYDGGTYNPQLIQTMGSTASLLLKQLSQNVALRKSELKYLDEPAQHLILSEFNDTRKYFREDVTLWDLFEEQSAENPNKTAIISPTEPPVMLSYQELKSISINIGSYLCETYKPGCVLLFLDKTEAMICSILGIWYAGFYSTSVDPNYPRKRVELIVHETNPLLIFANAKYKSLLHELFPNILVLDPVEIGHTEREGKMIEIRPTRSPTDLAYICFTSGTTGKPKGVMIHHRGLVNRISHQVEDRPDVWGLTENYIFDIFMYFAFGPLCSGKTLVLIKSEILFNQEKFYDVGNLYCIQYLSFTPSVASIFDLSRLKYLKSILLGGESLPPSHVQRLQKQSPQLEIINAYGPTEATVDSNWVVVSDPNHITIGPPMPNMLSFVLNKNLIPVPLGVVGEHYIGGVGLAYGYLNNEKLTREKFIQNPFRTQEEYKLGINDKLYKTGDFVKWTANGELVYISRNDSQVKVRGFRIELDGIENAIGKYAGIQDSRVTLVDSQLHGYYILENDNVDESDIRKYLESVLPPHEVPPYLFKLDKFPVTPTGKLDISSLPKYTAVTTQNSLKIQPKTHAEFIIQGIWAEILGQPPENIGTRDNFYTLGGDSIRSIIMSGKIRNEFKTHISVKELHTLGTIQSIAQKIMDDKFIAEQGILAGSFPLLPTQAFRYENHLSSSVDSFTIKCPILDVEKLEWAIQLLNEHHDALRIRIRKEGSNVQQFYDPKAIPPKLKTLDLSGVAENEVQTILNHVFAEWQENLDLENGPSWAVGYVTGISTSRSESFIFFATNRLVVDIESWSVLRNTIRDIYYDISLGPKTPSFRQYVSLVENYKLTPNADSKYWENNKLEKLSFSEESCEVSATKSLILNHEPALLSSAASKYNTSTEEIILSVYVQAICSILAKKNVSILLEADSRNIEIFRGIPFHHTVGPFSAIYPLMLAADSNPIVTLVNVKETLRNTPNAGIGYGLCYSLKRKDLPKITFTFSEILENEQESWILEKVHILPTFSSSEESVKENFDLKLHAHAAKSFTVLDLTCNNSGFLDQLCKELDSNWKSILKALNEIPRTHLTSSDIIFPISHETLTELQRDHELEGIFLGRSLQEGLIYNWLYQNPDANYYISQSRWTYKNDMNLQTLEEAWIKTVENYPALRLSFYWENGIYQLVHKKGLLDFKVVNIGSKTELENVIKAQREQPFDLAKLPLFRVRLFFLNRSEIVCVFTFHHIILDGWSVGIILRSVHDYYLNPHQLPSRDLAYIESQKYIQTKNSEKNIYWKQYLSNLKNPVDLSHLLSDQAISLGLKISEPNEVKSQDVETLVLSDADARDLLAISYENSLTLNAVLQYVLHEVLYLVGVGNETVVGVTFSGRDLPISDIQTSAGLYINTVPVFLDHSYDNTKPVLEIIQSLNDVLVSHSENTSTSINNMKKQKNEQRLFDIIFVFQNYPENPNQELELYTENSYVLEKTDYPLVVEVVCQNSSIMKINFIYASNVISGTTIQNLISVFQIILDQVIHTKFSVKKNELEFVKRDEQIHILQMFNGARRQCSGDKFYILNSNMKIVPIGVVGKLYAVEKSSNSGKLLHTLPNRFQTSEDKVLGINSSLFETGNLAKLTTNGDLVIVRTQETNEPLLKSVRKPSISSSKVPPKNDIELTLQNIWSEILKLHPENIGTQDNFYTLGGDSIRSIIMSGKIQTVFKTFISVKELRSLGTIEFIAMKISNEKFIENQAPATNSFPLLPTQRFYFGLNSHITNFFTIKTPPLNIGKLEDAIQKLNERCEALRIRFRREGTIIQQFCDPNGSAPVLKKLDLTGIPQTKVQSVLRRVFAEWTGNFDLENGPTWAVGYITGRMSQIFFSAHHLILDLSSISILINFLKSLYYDEVDWPKSGGYTEFLSNMGTYKLKNISEEQYWKNVLVHREKLAITEKGQRYGNVKTLSFDNCNLDHLAAAAEKFKTSKQELFLAIYIQSISSVFQGTNIPILLHSDTRDKKSSKLIGYYSTVYLTNIRVDPHRIKTLVNVKESCRTIPNAGIGFGMIHDLEKLNLQEITYSYFEFETHDKNGDGTWTLEEVNNQTGPGLLDCLVFIRNSNIHFRLVSSTSIEFLNTLCQEIHQNYETLLKCLIELPRTYLTPSDIPIPISERTLAELQSEHELEGIFLANSLHQGLILNWLYHDKSENYYICQNCWSLDPSILNLFNLKEAWTQTIGRYPALRLSFNWETELEIYQLVLRQINMDFEVIHVSTRSELESLIKEQRKQPFNLGKPPLFRVRVFVLKESTVVCCFTFHHIIMDGWSVPLIISSVQGLYGNPYQTHSYQDIAYLESQKYIQNRDNVNLYWKTYLKDVYNPVNLSVLLSDEAVAAGIEFGRINKTTEQKLHTVYLEEKNVQLLNCICREKSLDVDAVFQFILHEILHQLGDGNETIIGVTFSGRNIPVENIQNSVGLHINTLPVLLDHSASKSDKVSDIIKILGDTIYSHSENTNVLLSNLSQRNGKRLFDVIFIFQNYPDQVLDRDIKRDYYGKADYPLFVECELPTNGKIEIRFYYSTNLLSSKMIKLLGSSYLKIMNELIGTNLNLRKDEIENICKRNGKKAKLSYDLKITNSYNYTNGTKEETRETIEEIKVLEIWGHVLQLDPNLIGVEDNLFSLGGNSVHAILLTSQLQRIFPSWNVSVRDVMEFPTIRSFIMHLQARKMEECSILLG